MTAGNVDEMLESTNPDIRRLLGIEGEFGKGIGARQRLGREDRQGGRQLRRDLRAQRRHGLAAQDRPRPEQALEQGRHAVRPADPVAQRDRSAGRRTAAGASLVRAAAALRSAGMAVVDERQRDRSASSPARGQLFLYRPEVRQVALSRSCSSSRSSPCSTMLITNTAANLQRQNIASGFGFSTRTAGFDISQTLIDYNNASTYGRAFWVGLLNTLLVAGIGVVLRHHRRLHDRHRAALLATGWWRGSPPSMSRSIRNVPLLLQLFFWYFAVLKSLPPPRQSLRAARRRLPQRARALSAGSRCPSPASTSVLAGPGWSASWRRSSSPSGPAAARCARAPQFPVLWTSLALIVLLPLAVFFVVGAAARASTIPSSSGFNFQGGMVHAARADGAAAGPRPSTPAAFIAEIVRAGIQGVPKGQKEAAARASASPTARRCASSSSRRRCASSFRR